MSEPLTDGQLDEIEQRANRICRCDDTECVADLRKMAETDVPALTAALRQLRPEYGARVTYTDTLTAEGPISDDANDARARTAELAENSTVVSVVLLQRPVGKWQKLEKADRG